MPSIRTPTPWSECPTSVDLLLDLDLEVLEVFTSHTLAHMPGASAAAAMEDIVIDVPIVMTMENLAQVSV